MASSVMHRFAINVPREPKWFKSCAEGYLLSGRLNDICDHNANVARNAGRNDVSNQRIKVKEPLYSLDSNDKVHSS